MAAITRPDDLNSRFGDLDRRVRALENGRSLEFAAVKEGRIKVLDANNVERGGMGLQDDGSYGLRLIDEFGNMIFDPSGLVGVMKRIAVSPAMPTSPQAYTNTPTNLSSSTASFTLTRAYPPGSSILVISQINFYTNGGSASYGFAGLAVFNGSFLLIAQSPAAVHTATSGISACSPYIVLSGLPPDTYTVALQYWLDVGAGTTWQLYSGGWDAFQLGS